ncbi:ycf20-like protein isoform X2 [Canna indica]|uniref:Ycf20-like protein isoform X2 n=1 Tax=Canna indica TaxID=4628 RepID=A0AAQ3QEQ5_9LILI|nr:ycf20-like protein isoform X2 [Canna indica]
MRAVLHVCTPLSPAITMTTPAIPARSPFVAHPTLCLYLRPAITAKNRRNHMRSRRWRTAFALDTGGSPSNNDQENPEGGNTGLGRTRLGIIVRAAAVQLLEKLNAARKNFPMKIFLLLLGFYTANALATILGQTGDWDVLVAGVVVATIEGIGVLMYRKPFTKPLGRFQSLIVMVNYWKAGVCLGLFVDAFKLGS